MGAGADDEGQVEDVLVVDGVEGPRGQEHQVLAVRGERGRVVLEAEWSRFGDGQVGGVGELELAQRARAGVRPGEPGRVGREDQSGHVPVLAAVDFADLAGLPLDEQQAPVVRGDRHPAPVGCHGEFQDSAELPGAEPARRGTGRETGRRCELQRVVALRVRHPDHPLLAVHPEGARQPGPYAGFGGERAGGAGAVGDPVHGAADTDRAAARGVVGRRLPEGTGGVQRVCLPVGALSAEPDVEPARLGPVEVVQEPQFPGGGVHETGAVTRGVPGVEAVEGGVPAEFGPVGEGRVHRAHALVVGEERDPPPLSASLERGDPHPHPHRVLDVPVQLLVQPYEVTVARTVDPQLPRRTAPVALPAGGLQSHGRGREHEVRPVDHIGDGPVRQGGGRSAVERDGVGPGAAAARLALGADREDLAVRGPAAHPGLPAAPVGEALRGAAVDRGDVHLGGAVAGGGPGDGRPVGRDARQGDRHVVGADPPGPAAVERGEPHVVLGGEGDQVAVQMRIPEIRRRSGRHGLSHPITIGRGGVRGQTFGSLVQLRPGSGHLPSGQQFGCSLQ